MSRYWICRASSIFALALIVLVITNCTSRILTNDKSGKLDHLQSEDVALYTFDVIEITPDIITAQEPFSIRMKVENTGKIAGIYEARLSIDGIVVESKNWTVKPLESVMVEFGTTLSNPGPHSISIGPQRIEINVIAKQRITVPIRIDHDVIDGCDPLVDSTSLPVHVLTSEDGHMIALNSPDELTLNSVSVLGYIKDSTYDYNNDPVVGGPGRWVYGPDIAIAEPTTSVFTINIYDYNRKKLYSGDFNKALFSYSPKWVTVSVPDVLVKGDFKIELLTHNQPRLNALGAFDTDILHRYVVHTWYHQLCIGYENAVDVRSGASTNGILVPGHYFTYNWLIRAAGYLSNN
jgi:hypothetical protein